MADGKFATSVSCMDGRIQAPISEWVRSNHGVDYVDTITEPGVDGRVAGGGDLGRIRAMAEISIKAHGSRVIVVSGHHDCAGNPVSEQEHISQIKKSVEVISSWGLDAEVVGVWVDDSWAVTFVAP